MYTVRSGTLFLGLKNIPSLQNGRSWKKKERELWKMSLLPSSCGEESWLPEAFITRLTMKNILNKNIVRTMFKLLYDISRLHLVLGDYRYIYIGSNWSALYCENSLFRLPRRHGSSLQVMPPSSFLLPPSFSLSPHIIIWYLRRHAPSSQNKSRNIYSDVTVLRKKDSFMSPVPHFGQ